MNISEALDLRRGDTVTVVGGGGKTTIILKLAEELAKAGNKIVVTTTVKMYPPEALKIILSQDTRDLNAAVELQLNSSNCVVVGERVNQAGKLTGLAEESLQQVRSIAGLDYLLIEGDGAKGKPFKAPRAHEPVIPEFTTVVLVVIGVECLGQPLSGEYFHAVEQIKLLTGLEMGEIVTARAIQRIMLHRLGYQKNVPGSARWIVFINKVESQKDLNKAVSLAAQLEAPGVNKVIIGAAGNSPPIIY